MNNGLKIALIVLGVIMIAFVAQRCSYEGQLKGQKATYETALESKDQYIGQLRKDSTLITSERNACQDDAGKARQIAANMYDRLTASLTAARTATAGTSAKQQQKDVVRYYVNQKLIPADRLRDTLYVPGPRLVDSTMVAAAKTANLWLDIYRGQIDSLGRGISTERVANQRLEQQNDEQREALSDCADETDALKAKQKQQRKRTFWAVVKGVGAGVVAGVVGLLVLLH